MNIEIILLALQVASLIMLGISAWNLIRFNREIPKMIKKICRRLARLKADSDS